MIRSDRLRPLVTLSALTALTALSALASAQGRLIALDSNRSVYEMDSLTGAKTLLGVLPSSVSTAAELAYDRTTGTLYLSSTGNDSLYTVDLATLSATLVGPYGDSTVVMHGLEVDGSGTMYAASGTTANNNVYTVDKSTGAATVLASSGLTSFLNLGYDLSTDTMYATSSGTDSLYTLDRATGAFTLVEALGTSTNPNGLTYDSDTDRLLLVDNSTDNLYSINRATGAATVLGSTGSGNLLGLVYIPAAPVPEPATMAALGLGAAALLRRRSRRAN